MQTQTIFSHDNKEMVASNSTFKKLTVQWLYVSLYFASTFVVADSFVLQNPILRQGPKRYTQA